MFEDATRHVLKQDKRGVVWDVYQIDSPNMISWYAQSECVEVGCEAHVKTQKIIENSLTAYDPVTNAHLRQLPMAILGDVRVDEQLENRGLGSMLVREAIAECEKRGHKGIQGTLSRVDAGHFDKLEHFYTSLGFSVVFFRPEDPEFSSGWRGKVELAF